MLKRFKFVKPFYNQNGESIPVGTQVDIIDDKIWISGISGGSQIPPEMYDSFHKFIEDEYAKPNYLKEIPVPYNKA